MGQLQGRLARPISFCEHAICDLWMVGSPNKRFAIPSFREFPVPERDIFENGTNGLDILAELRFSAAWHIQCPR